MAGLGAQVGDAVVVLPDFNPGCPFQEGASRAQRSGVRTALDGVAGCDVVGRIELVKAVMAHAPKRSASASVCWHQAVAARWGHATGAMIYRTLGLVPPIWVRSLIRFGPRHPVGCD